MKSVPTQHINNKYCCYQFSPLQTSQKTVLVLIGSFNPITKAHIQILERAYEHINLMRRYHVEKLIISPVHEKYPYKQVKPSNIRLDMIKLAIKNSKYSNLFEINDDEVLNPQGFLPTYKIMQILKQKYYDYQIFLVCGQDLIEGMMNPSYWPEINVNNLFDCVSTLTFLRSDNDDIETLRVKINNSILKTHQSQILVVQEKISNASSTAVRQGNLEYLYDNVAEYIRSHHIQW